MSHSVFSLDLNVTTIVYTGCNVGWFQWSVFRSFEIINLCFVVAICDLVCAVEAMYRLL